MAPPTVGSNYHSTSVFLCELQHGVRGQLIGTSSLLPCGTGSQTQASSLPSPLPTEPSPIYHWIHFSKSFCLSLAQKSVNHCDTAFPSSSELTSSPSNKSSHCHQDASSTIWYLSSANYIYFTPITSLCSLFLSFHFF